MLALATTSARWMHLRKPLDYDRVGRVLGKWRQFAGLIYFHLLLSGLEHSGKLPADAWWATGSHPGVMAHHG